MRNNSSPISLAVDANTTRSLPAHLERKIAQRWKEWEPWVLMQVRPRCNYDLAVWSAEMAWIRRWHRNYLLHVIWAGISMRVVRRHRLDDPGITDGVREMLVRAATQRRKKAWLARHRAITDPHSKGVSELNNPDIGASSSLVYPLLRLESVQVPPQGTGETIASLERRVTIDSIQKRVSEYFYLRELRDPDLKAQSNKRIFVFPRQVAMYIARQLTGASLQEIGREFGGRHHTTVLHSIHKIEEMRHSDKAVNRTISQLSEGCASECLRTSLIGSSPRS